MFSTMITWLTSMQIASASNPPHQTTCGLLLHACKQTCVATTPVSTAVAECTI